MYSLREVLAQAQAAGTAIGHFNVADLVLLKAVFASARELSPGIGWRIRGGARVCLSRAACGPGEELA